MPTKIRLQRHGKKHQPFFHIVVADGRAPRDGKFIEKLGTYNPNTNPATIELNFDRALHWVQTGAQPTDTTRAILSYKGVLYKDHLLRGVAKKAHTEDQVEEKFNKWLSEKAGKVESKKDKLKATAEETEAKRMAVELEAKEKRAAKAAAKATPPAEETPVAETESTEATEAVAQTEEAPATEAKTEEVKTEEAPAKEEAKAEEAPKAEAPAEEPKAEEAKEEEKKTEE